MKVMKSALCLMNHEWFRRIELQLLMNLTAHALRLSPQRIWTKSSDDALRAYAQFTSDKLRHGVDKQLLQRMNGEAFKMGTRLRRLFHLRHQADIEQFVIGLYHNIGIELKGHIPGNLCFRRCYFSQYYTPEICLAASALDDGIMRGVVGSGRLEFHQRITEGNNCCLARFGECEIKKSEL